MKQSIEIMALCKKSTRQVELLFEMHFPQLSDNVLNTVHPSLLFLDWLMHNTCTARCMLTQTQHLFYNSKLLLCNILNI